MAVRETERLILRQFTADDAGFILALLNDPTFIENIADKGVRTLDDARSYIAGGPVASYEKHGFGLWAVVRKQDGVPVGMCGLIKRDHLDDVDLGYALLREHAGVGYASEAAAASLSFARETLGLKRIVAIVNPENERSIALLVKLGFVHEGMITMPGEDREINLFAAVP